MSKIIRSCTVPQSLGFVKEMLPDLGKKYEVVVVSSPGEQMDEIAKEYGVRERGKARPVVVQEALKEEKTLVNLEMVRIKRHGEQRTGLEIYIRDGKYGFLKDGREICGPFSESDIYVHKDFIFLGRRMMYWNDMDTVYEVCGFEKWYVNVESLTNLSKLMGQRKQG